VCVNGILKSLLYRRILISSIAVQLRVTPEQVEQVCIGSLCVCVCVYIDFVPVCVLSLL